MNPLKRKVEDLQQLRDISNDVNEADFVPYACHVGPHTILTKNGELLQTIKVVGFTYEDITRQSDDLRTTIRAALTSSLNRSDYAVWIHTIRRRQSLMPPGDFPQDFSQLLNQAWREQHQWDDKYVNEVYITLVKEGESASIAQPHHFIQSLIPPLELRRRWKYIEKSRLELTDTVNRVMKKLESFGARKLGLVEKQDAIYSEPVSFLAKLTTLIDKPRELSKVALAEYLTPHEVTFGFNAMEVRNANGRRRFGAMLSMKDYRELSTDTIDVLLQTDAEFIISQCMDFLPAKKALEGFRKQEQIYKVSEAEDMMEQTGLKTMLESDQKSPVDFGEQQINLFILGDSVPKLERNVKNIVGSLNELGVIAVREDIKFPEAYWSQLPGNFEFLRRLNPISTRQVGGFASINNLPAGLASGSIWGPPVSVFYTAAKTPYFFNFHIESRGHTSLIGPYGAGKTCLMNFLVAQAQKFQPRLFYFDRNRGAEIFLRSIGADYQLIDRRPPIENHHLTRPEIYDEIKLNPLQMEDTPQNRTFLLVWLDALLRADKLYRPEMSEEFWPALQAALDYTLSLPKAQRMLIPLIDFLKEHHPKVAAKMYSWYTGGEFELWYNHNDDTLDISSGRVGFELARLMEQPRVAPSVFAYLIHRVMLTLDGRPTIIVLDEAWDLLDNPVFAARLGGWLEMLRSRNALAILATERAEDVISSPINAVVMEHIATQIYMPNENHDPEDFQKTFGLSATESEFLKLMSRRKRQFLLKRGEVSIVAELNLEGHDSHISVLSAQADALMLMENMVAKHGKDPARWLPIYMTAVEQGELEKMQQKEQNPLSEEY
jgi:type IV secretion system protein VirB4